MAKIPCASVDDYIALQPEAARAVLERVRRAIAKAAPGIEESISYNIPTYKLHGGRLLYFAGWKKHCSLYPATPEVLAAFRDDLKPYSVVKSTIQFPYSVPVPTALIERIAKFRAREILKHTKSGKAAPRKP
jgi:uncharacterized protein YdhG (YjbR/CyaY superfamily)